MDNSFESDPFRESMKQLLDQLPNNSEKVKTIFKSLLLVHISKIKDQEERSTWQSFIHTLDNMSQSDQASYSFGPLSNSGYSTDFKKFLKHKKFQNEFPDVYEEKLKRKIFGILKKKMKIRENQKKALKKVALIGLRLRFVEGFWKWHMFSAGLELIANEFFEKKIKAKTFQTLVRGKFFLAVKTWKWNLQLKVLISWAEFVRDVFREKINRFEEVKGLKHSKVPQNIRRNLKNQQLGKEKKKFINERSDSEDSFASNGKIFNRYQPKRLAPFSQRKRNHLNEMKKRFQAQSQKQLKEKTLQIWVESTKKSIFLEKLFSSLSAPLLKFSFSRLKKTLTSALTSLKQKYSIDHLSDYELSVKITILERKLAGLHQHLLSEQITNRGLISERAQLYKLLS